MKYLVFMLGTVCFTASVIAHPDNTWNDKKRNNGEFGGTFRHAGVHDKETHTGRDTSIGPFSGRDGHRDYDFSGKEYGKGINGRELPNAGKFGGSTFVSMEYESGEVHGSGKYDGIPYRPVSYPGQDEVAHGGSHHGSVGHGYQGHGDGTYRGVHFGPAGHEGRKDYDGGKNGGSDYGHTVYGGGDHMGTKYGEGEYGIGGYGSHAKGEFDRRSSGGSNGSPDGMKYFTENKQFMSLAKLYLDRVLKQN